MKDLKEHLSDLSGKKRALLIGITYIETDKIVYSAVNEVYRMRDLLLGTFGFSEDNVIILTENNGNDPTKQRILDEMQKLVSEGETNDSLFFYYAGHSGFKVDQVGDEWDGRDEAIMPSDWFPRNFIIDDEIYDCLVKNLPLKCRLTTVFDCCYSGTILDLPHEYDVDGTLIEPKVTDFPYPYVVTGKKFDPNINFGKQLPIKDVICFSSCNDTQSSKSRNSNPGSAFSTFSKYFVQVIQKKPTIRALLSECAEEIKKRSDRRQKMYCKKEFVQTPQLSSGYLLNLDAKFMI